MNNIATIFRESRVGRFFVPLGIILIAVGIVLFVINDHHKDFIKTEATVTKTELYEESYTDAEGNYFDEFSKQDNLVKKNEENIKYVLDYLNIPVNNDSRKFYALMFDMDYNKQHDLPFDNNYMK